ncbi:MAG: hypothetical protein ACOYB2_11110 [Limnohabitans sp.]
MKREPHARPAETRTVDEMIRDALMDPAMWLRAVIAAIGVWIALVIVLGLGQPA